MRVDGGQESVNAGVDFAGAGRPRRRDARPARRGLSADHDARALQHDGRPAPRSSPGGTSTSSSTTTSRWIAAAHRVKFGGYYFHLKLRPQQPDNARGAFTYTGQFSGNAFADFLLGYPDFGDVGHRPRRRGRPHQLAAPLRPGRLAGARQPDAEPGAALRVQPAHVRREQPPVVDRPGRRPAAGSSWRATTNGQHRPERAGAAAAGAAARRDLRRGRLGAGTARSERGAAGAADRVRPDASTTRRG